MFTKSSNKAISKLSLIDTGVVVAYDSDFFEVYTKNISNLTLKDIERHFERIILRNESFVVISNNTDYYEYDKSSKSFFPINKKVK